MRASIPKFTNACGRLAFMLRNKCVSSLFLICLSVVVFAQADSSHSFGMTGVGMGGGAFAQVSADWTEAFAPHRVVGNVYYVGSKGLASYLITTPQGHILINSSLESSVPLIQASVEKLGFRFSDVKILLISHAHWDHCAGSARVKELTGATYMVMDADRKS